MMMYLLCALMISVSAETIEGCFKMEGNICVDCSTGLYLSRDGKSCTSCAAGCISCNQYGECGGCITGMTLNKNTGVCESCGINCQKCGDSNKCLQCKSGYYLDQAVCSRCEINCSVCESGSKCTLCESTFELTSNPSNGIVTCFDRKGGVSFWEYAAIFAFCALSCICIALCPNNRNTRYNRL